MAAAAVNVLVVEEAAGLRSCYHTTVHKQPESEQRWSKRREGKRQTERQRHRERETEGYRHRDR